MYSKPDCLAPYASLIRTVYGVCTYNHINSLTSSPARARNKNKKKERKKETSIHDHAHNAAIASAIHPFIPSIHPFIHPNPHVQAFTT